MFDPTVTLCPVYSNWMDMVYEQLTQVHIAYTIVSCRETHISARKHSHVAHQDDGQWGSSSSRSDRLTSVYNPVWLIIVATKGKVRLPLMIL